MSFLSDLRENHLYNSSKRRFRKVSRSDAEGWLDSAFYSIRSNMDEHRHNPSDPSTLIAAREALIIVLASVDDLLDRTP